MPAPAASSIVIWLALLAAQPAVTIQIDPAIDGIHPLTAKTLAMARACGEDSRYPLCVGNIDLGICTAVHEVFEVTLSTPFSRAAKIFAEAHRKFEKPPAILTAAGVNGARVIVKVEPIRKINEMRSVENVVLRRDGVIHRPVASKKRVGSYTNAFGVTKSATEGDFTFAFEPWAPTEGRLELVVIPVAGDNVTCRLDKFDLANIK